MPDRRTSRKSADAAGTTLGLGGACCRAHAGALRWISVVAFCLLLGVSSSALAASIFDLTYEGRITDPTGKPFQGTFALQIDFYHEAEGGEPVLTIIEGLGAVPLSSGGIFQAKVSLSSEDFAKVFPDVSQPVYLAFTDLTHSAGQPLPRQQVMMLPYAGKVPVDGKTVRFGSDGKLTAAPRTRPKAGEFLTMDASGEFSWASPFGSSASGSGVSGGPTPSSPHTKGRDLVLSAGNGTGNGGSGSIVLQTAAPVAGGGATTADSLATRMVIDASGNVGIGTPVAGAKLTVNGSVFLNSENAAIVADWGESRLGLVKKYGSRPMIAAGSATNITFAHSSAKNLFDSDIGSQTMTPRMTISSDGNVGIGNTAPYTLLSVGPLPAVSGVSYEPNSLSLTHPSPASDTVLNDPRYLFYMNRPGTSNVTWGPTAAFALSRYEHVTTFARTRLDLALTHNSFGDLQTRVTFLSNGNVGIGTTTPTAPLDVLASGGKDVLIGGGATTGSELKLTNATTTHFSIYNSGNNNLTFANTSATNTTNTAGTVLMSLTSTGNVGIGTTSLNGKLDIVGGALMLNGGLSNTSIRPAVAAGRIAGEIAGYSAAGAWADDGFLRLSAGGGTTASSKAYIDLSGYSTQADMNSNIVLGTNGAERIRITASGNVGIGTTAPATPLHVINEIRTSGGVNGFATVDRGDGVNRMIMYLSGDYLKFDDYSVATRFSIHRTSGNVGIGTTSPSYTLHVVGTAGLSTGTAWTNASDLRLKDIEGDYEYGLEEIKRLHTVRFRYKRDNPLELPSDHRMTGFIAQEVQDVIPEAVHQRADGYLELNVDPIHWATVNAVQELAAENAQLRQRAERAEQRAAKAEADMAEMKQALCAKWPDLPFCL